MSAAVSFSEYQERLLYDSATGFFEWGGGAGRNADFITSPELGSVFAECLAAGVDRWWQEAGSPSEFVFIEAGAGRGTLARAILAADLACARALRYVTVERSQALRDQQRLALDDAVEICAELPSHHANKHGVVFANELLDNIPCDIYEYTDDGWHEVLMPETLVPASPSVTEHLGELVAQPAVGARVPLQQAARNWVNRARNVLDSGRVIAIDYTDHTASMATRPYSEWLRSYRRHGFGGNVFQEATDCDITCEVALDQLPATDRLLDQAAFLVELGIKEIGARASQRAGTADLAGLVAKSRANETRALTDPAGLGAFTVMEWAAAGDPAQP